MCNLYTLKERLNASCVPVGKRDSIKAVLHPRTPFGDMCISWTKRTFFFLKCSHGSWVCWKERNASIFLNKHSSISDSRCADISYGKVSNKLKSRTSICLAAWCLEGHNFRLYWLSGSTAPLFLVKVIHRCHCTPISNVKVFHWCWLKGVTVSLSSIL